MKRWQVWLILLAALVGIGVGITLSTSRSGRSKSTASHASVTTVSGENVTKIDGQDPNQSGCSPTGEYLQDTKTPVFAANGNRRGELVLRRSSACQAIWGRVNGLEGHGHYLVEIDLYRPSDHKELLFHDADTENYVFSNMLSERIGCVYATAYVARGKRRGPIARTPCR
jgi:hypothetical protein